MKNIPLLVLLSLLVACNQKVKKETSSESDSMIVSQEKEVNKSMESGDYITLLTNFNCSMDISELAKVLEVPEADLSIPDTAIPNKCLFSLKGFGVNVLDGGSRLLWGPLPSSKSQNKKEISSYLKRKKEGLKIMGMDIVLAKTGDCYLAYQPAHGRLIIYNENYDQAFLINYGRRNANTDRTEEQHEELKLKMTDLANYLIKKHRK